MNFLKYVRGQWDRVTAWVAVSAGVLAVFLGWVGVSQTPYVAEQIPYVVSGGVLGLLFVAVGAMLWISADLRDEWRKLDAIEAALKARDDGAVGPAPATRFQPQQDDPEWVPNGRGPEPTTGDDPTTELLTPRHKRAAAKKDGAR